MKIENEKRKIKNEKIKNEKRKKEKGKGKTINEKKMKKVK